jgi:putative SOS response-associated peptidase YedK
MPQSAYCGRAYRQRADRDRRAPTQNVPVIRSVEGKPHGSLTRWSAISFFARGVSPKYSPINARVQTEYTAASYRGPWTRGERSLVVASTYVGAVAS